MIKVLAASSLLIVGAVQAGEEGKQPIAPGIEAPGYQWNQIRNEQMIALQINGDPVNGAVAFENCAGCHGIEALGESDGSYPRLAGQHRTVLIKELTDIRSGVRDNPKMFPFADQHVITTRDVADIAAYLSGLTVTVENGKGPGQDLKQGEALYNKDCVKCHGRSGEGDAESFYPKVAGQHYEYLLRQIRNIHGGKRRNADPDMVKATDGYRDVDMQAVTDYISHLPAIASPGS